MSETSRHFLTHCSLLGSAQLTQGTLQFLRVPGCCLPRAAWQAWSRWLCGRSTIRSDEFPVPPSFSERANNDVFQPQAWQVSHLPFPGCGCTEHSSPCPCSSRSPAAFPHSLNSPCRLHPFQRAHIEGMTPYSPSEAPQSPSHCTGSGFGALLCSRVCRSGGFPYDPDVPANLKLLSHCTPKCALKFLQRLWEDRTC